MGNKAGSYSFIYGGGHGRPNRGKHVNIDFKEVENEPCRYLREEQ